MIHKLREQRGDFTVNGVLILLLVFLLLILGLSCIGVANRAMRVHSMAAELVRYIELRGQVDGSADAELARLEAASGIRVDCSIRADYIRGTSRIQLGDRFEVTLSYEASFGVGGVLSVPVQLQSTVSGRSEQYWPA